MTINHFARPQFLENESQAGPLGTELSVTGKSCSVSGPQIPHLERKGWVQFAAFHFLLMNLFLMYTQYDKETQPSRL